MFTPQKLLELITQTDPVLKGKSIKDVERYCCLGRVARKDGTNKLWTVNAIKYNNKACEVVVADGKIL